MIRSVVIWTLMAMLLSVGGQASDVLDSRGEGIGGTVMMSQPSALQLARVSSTSIPDRKLSVEVAYGRWFELSAFDNTAAAFSGRLGHMALSALIQQFGTSSLYSEQQARLWVDYVSDRVASGIGWTGIRVTIGDSYGDLSAGSWGARLALKYRRWQLGLTGDRLNKPHLEGDIQAQQPLWSGYLEFAGPGGQSLLARVTAEQDRTPQFGFGQVVGLSGTAAVHWGISTAPTKYGGGVRLAWSALSLTYTVSYHPVLGLTHISSLSIDVALSPPKP